MQSFKVTINNHNMNILHQNNEIKDESNCRNKKYCLLGGKCLSLNTAYLRKITPIQPNFGVAEKSLKDFTPNSLLLKITQMTKSFRNNTGKIKGKTFIPKVTWSIVRECPPCNLSERKCQSSLNEIVEINSYKGKNLLNKRQEL